jgi:hypothetical protein
MKLIRFLSPCYSMSTILRIGSLMKVGFGSAGVEIIRNNLEKGQSKHMLVLSSKGSRVSGIFLFCDIRCHGVSVRRSICVHKPHCGGGSF